MVRGFYSVAAGLLGQQKAFNTTSNNIANASTAGFKNQATIESSFGDHLIARISSNDDMSEKNIGKGSFITINSSVYTDFSQGAIEETGRPIDMAIEGEGFFLLKTSDNEEVLTRNGQFEIDEDNNLVLFGVGKVLDENKKAITLETSDFNVDSLGNIKTGENSVATLYISSVPESEKLISTGNGVYKNEDGYTKGEKGSYKVLQGALEKSNMNISQEMSKIIAGQNRYNSCSQILKIYDRINEMTVNQIGKIG